MFNSCEHVTAKGNNSVSGSY